MNIERRLHIVYLWSLGTMIIDWVRGQPLWKFGCSRKVCSARYRRNYGSTRLALRFAIKQSKEYLFTKQKESILAKNRNTHVEHRKMRKINNASRRRTLLYSANQLDLVDSFVFSFYRRTWWFKCACLGGDFVFLIRIMISSTDSVHFPTMPFGKWWSSKFDDQTTLISGHKV